MGCSLLGALSHFRTHCSGATVHQSPVCVPLTKHSRQDTISVNIQKQTTSTHSRVCKGNEH